MGPQTAIAALPRREIVLVVSLLNVNYGRDQLIAVVYVDLVFPTGQHGGP